VSWICEACSKFISATSSDPLVSTKGLGWKNYHYACAQVAWGTSVNIIMTKELARKGKFLVQCTFIKGGVPTTRLSDFTNSLEEAEEYFHRQVQACPAGGGVDCAVLLVLKDGKHTQVDEHSFGVPTSSGSSDAGSECDEEDEDE